MAFGRFSPDIVEDWIDDVAAMTIWGGLTFVDPFGVADPLTVEIAGGTYARVRMYFTRTDTNVLTLTSGISINGLPPDTVIGAIVGWNAQFNGGMIFADLLDPPAVLALGGSYKVAAGELVVGIDIAES